MHNQGEPLATKAGLSAAPDCEFPLEGRRILIMDDEPILALDLQLTLQDARAVVIGPATTVAAALDLMEAQRLDCALLDVRMGRDDGFAVARKLSERGVPWLFHTGDADPNRLQRDWPQCRILTKPSAPSELIAGLASLLR